MAYDPNDPETKTALKAAVEAAITEATSGLIAKRDELLAKLKKATKDAQIDPAEHQSLMAEKEEVDRKLSEALKTLKTAQAQADQVKKDFEKETGLVSRLLIDNGLTEAIIKAGVKPEMTKAVKALLASQVSLKAEGDNKVAVVGDKPLSDFVTEWSKTDEGKHFIAAPVNKGGGAGGGGGEGHGDLSAIKSPEARLAAINQQLYSAK